MSALRPRGFVRTYGSGPLHLLGLLLTFAVAGYAALKVYDDPVWWRYALWYVGAALVHDLVLAPAYGALDRLVQPLLGRRRRADPGDVNYVRVPAVLSGLLLLVFGASILERGEPAFTPASGLTQDPFLERWLLITAVLFAASALLYALRGRRRA